MAIPGINFFNEGENSIKLNNPGAPQFMNTIFGAEPMGGGTMGVDAFEAAEPTEAPSGVDAAEATEPADPADPSEAPRRTTKKTTSKYVPSEKTVKTIADSWADKWGISNTNGEFTRFVRKVYDIAQELNITKLNGKRDSRFPNKEDQIVDEILAIFAGESSFNPKAVNSNLYYGIFQFSEISMKDCAQQNKLKEKGLKRLSMAEFRKLPRIKQLDYFVAHINLAKMYSRIGNKPISAAQAWAMVKGPFNGQKLKAIKAKSDSIQTIRNNRGMVKFT